MNNQTPLANNDPNAIPNEVMAHWMELYIILHCEYDTLEEKEADINRKKLVLNTYGWDIIRTEEYTDLVRLADLN